MFACLRVNATSLPMRSAARLLPVLCVLNEWERRDFNIKMDDGDLEVLREGTCVILVSVIATTNAVKAEGGSGDAISGFEGSARTLCVKASDWAGRSRPAACVIHCVNYERYQKPLLVENGLRLRQSRRRWHQRRLSH